MQSIMREIIMYIIFLWVLMVIVYASQDRYNFLMKDHYTDLLVTGNGNYTFTKIRSIPHFWRWVRTGLLPVMYPVTLYNGQLDESAGSTLFGDRSSYLLGHAVFRQLRVKPGSCHIKTTFGDLIPECNVPYSIDDEDREHYGTGWVHLNSSADIEARSEYNYTSSDDIDSYPYWGRHAMYMGGGYVSKLKNNYNHTAEQIQRLYQEAWIDRYTRAVFVEFSLYNAQVNLFASINFLIEFLPAGGGHPIHRVDVIRLFTFYEGFTLVRITCEIIFLLFIIYFIIHESIAMRKEKTLYWKKFWNWMEWVIIVFSIAAAIVYFYRLYATNKELSTFTKSGGSTYINLQYVTYLNEVLNYLVGWVVFVASLKFLKLLRFNRRIGLLAATIRHAALPLLQFSFQFFIVFFAFTTAFFLVFSGKLYDFATYINAIETLVTTMLNKFHFNGIYRAEPILGPILFFCFMTFISFMLLNMFISIVNESFKVVKHDLLQQENDYEILDFMIRRFKRVIGLGSTKKKAKETPDESYESSPTESNKHSQTDVIKQFPAKVDELLNFVAEIYFKNDETRKKSRKSAKRKGSGIMVA